jgi:putative multiple sugar transport system permease protein
MPGGHTITLLLGVIAIIFFVLGQISSRKKKAAYGFEVLPPAIFALKLVFISAIVGLVAWVLAGYNGISWTAIIVCWWWASITSSPPRRCWAGTSTRSAATRRRPS